MVVVWLCVFLYTIVPGEGNANSLKYKKQWARCSDEDPFLILRNIAMENCVSECNIRRACLAVNYWTRRLQCDMLFNDTTCPLQNGQSTQPCVFVRKTDLGPANELLSNCQLCDGISACDVNSGDCVVKECRQLLVPNATIKGNSLSVGSKIRIYCSSSFSQHPPETLSICLENGTWSNAPTCHYLFACMAPPSVANASVDAGTRAVGDERNYSCNAGFSAIGNDTFNMTIQCQEDGTWSSTEFQCVADCGDPVDVVLATVSLGNNLEGTIRTYTCDDGYVGNSSVMEVTCQASNDWSPVQFSCIPNVCEPGWDQIGYSCYLVYDVKVSLDVAKAFCNANGSHIVEFETEAEHTAFMAYYQMLGHKWWIGLTYVEEAGTWRWMTTGKVANFINWDIGEPVPGIGYDYVTLAMNTGLWQVAYPSDMRPVVCER